MGAARWDLREKPVMTSAHNWLAEKLGYMLMSQLDWSMFQVRTDKGSLQRPGATYYIPMSSSFLHRS